MPTEAAASAGASLMPSPTIAIPPGRAASALISATLPSGNSGARISLMPTDAPIAVATRALSPDNMIVVPTSRASSRSVSATPSTPRKRSSRQTIIVV
jgi:hypothetical protein